MNLENDSKWLFKYLPFNFNAVKLLTNNELWFGKPDTQNDPNEAEFILTSNKVSDIFNDFEINIQDDLDSIIEKTYSNKTFPIGNERLEFETNLKKVIRDYLGICSMSVKYNDILMWAHYSDNNKGICIVFNKEMLTKHLRVDADKVIYTENITNANFKKNGKIGNLISDKTFYFNKLNNWKYEDEFRFVKRFNDGTPLDKIDRLKSFPEEAIAGIILGEQFPIENFKTLINLVYLKNPEKEFHFWKCIKNLHKNSMDICQITNNHANLFLDQNDYPFEHILNITKNKLIRNISIH